MLSIFHFTLRSFSVHIIVLLIFFFDIFFGKFPSSIIENKSNERERIFLCIAVTCNDDLLRRPWNNRSESGIMFVLELCWKIYCIHRTYFLFVHLFCCEEFFEWQVQPDPWWSELNWLMLFVCFFEGEVEKLYILATILGLLSIFSVSLCVGVINQNRLFISPWIWLKYALISLQLIRFISVIVELSASDKNPAGASPIFELLLLGEIFPIDCVQTDLNFRVNFAFLFVDF